MNRSAELQIMKYQASLQTKELNNLNKNVVKNFNEILDQSEKIISIYKVYF